MMAALSVRSRHRPWPTKSISWLPCSAAAERYHEHDLGRSGEAVLRAKTVSRHREVRSTAFGGRDRNSHRFARTAFLVDRQRTELGASASPAADRRDRPA